SGGIPSRYNLKAGWKHICDMKYYFFLKFPGAFTFIKSQANKNIHIISNYRRIEHLTLESNRNSNIHSLKIAETYKWRVSNPRKNYITLAFLEDDMYTSYLTYNI